MKRREFCKLAAASAAAAALPAAAQSASTAPAPAASASDKYDYADFCATPADQRVFSILRNGRIASVKLDEATWKPTEWGTPPELPGGSWDGVPMESPIAGLSGQGPYRPTWDSLLQYEAPEWYRDAKFGIWAHWSPQSVPEAGDWYARNMYIEHMERYQYHMKGSNQYLYHEQHYGVPSLFGYKDLCPQWTLLNWEPDALIERYKKAGAKFFFALANHHDNFDAWDSKHQPWNAMQIGPHRDVVGVWAKAARQQGLRFGVTVHQARNWWWFQTSHGADQSGPRKGIPYDGRLTAPEGRNQWWQGLDPQRLYGPKHPYDALPDVSYVKNFYDRTRDLIDQHNPDLLYFDNPLFPLGWAGMNIGAYYYNHNLQSNGRMEGVINIKNVPDRLTKAVVADCERGLNAAITPHPWQSETCIGNWHYNRNLFEQPGEFGGYLPPRAVIHWLIDTVSKNGTFVLNIPGLPDGTIDSKEIAILDQITRWIDVNGEAIFATRPWKIFGEGPNMVKSGSFQGDTIGKLGEKDIRFTRSKDNRILYALVLGVPAAAFTIQALGTSASTNPGKIQHVQILGTDQKVAWRQSDSGLSIEMPSAFRPVTDYAIALKIIL